MIIYLIRHGHAVDREIWNKPDLERPLTKKGEKRAEKAFQKFFSIYEQPKTIVTSEATRAFQTGDILQGVCGGELHMRANINPGAMRSDFEAILTEFQSSKVIAIVGHEPDLSSFASEYLTDGFLVLDFKKGSICHIEDKYLVNYVQQKVLL